MKFQKNLLQLLMLLKFAQNKLKYSRLLFGISILEVLKSNGSNSLKKKKTQLISLYRED